MELSNIAQVLVFNYSTQSGCIDNSQLEAELFTQWEAAMDNMFETTFRIFHRFMLTSQDDVDTISRTTDFYERFRNILDLIGIVNGYPLRRNKDAVQVFVAYADRNVSLNPAEAIKLRKKFVEKVEYYFARMIIEQQGKTKQMLEEDEEDFRIVRRLRHKRTRQIDRSEKKLNSCLAKARTTQNTLQSTPAEPNIEKEIVTMNLSPSDTLHVICADDACTEKRHYMQNVMGYMAFYNKSDKAFQIRRCAICKQYQMLWADFEKMWKDYDLPKVNIVYDGSEDDDDYSDFPLTSVFSKMGYSVAQNSGLSKQMRQSILKQAIDEGKATKWETIQFLQRRININGMKEGNESAAAKWAEDLSYVRTL